MCDKCPFLIISHRSLSPFRLTESTSLGDKFNFAKKECHNISNGVFIQRSAASLEIISQDNLSKLIMEYKQYYNILLFY